MNVRWTVNAERDRRAIWSFIANENRQAANHVDSLFEAAADLLEVQPLAGRAGLLPGTRELLAHTSYMLVYEVNAGIVVVLAVVHTRRSWPPQ